MFFAVTKLETLIIDTDDFRTDPQLLIDIVQSLDLVLKIHLVTRSNRPHDAFQDRTTGPRTTTEQNKLSTLLKRIIVESEAPPTSTVFLCRNRMTVEQVRPLLIGTIVFTNRNLSDEEKFLLYQEGPDYVVDSLDSLLICLSLKDQGFMGEIDSAPNRLAKSAYNYSSTALMSDEISTRSARIVKLPNLENPDSPFFVMGRYFGPADPRHQIHALSLRILKFKRHHSPQIDLFSELFSRGIESATGVPVGCDVLAQHNYDLITQVPSRPEVGDRLACILSKLRETYSQPDAIQPDILRCVKSYPSLKGLNLQSRKANVENVFRAQKNVSGKRIVLIDDIVTTGSTANACINELKLAGAASVVCVCLAYHPYAIRSYNFTHPTCTTCDEPVDVKFEPPDKICFECHNGKDSETIHSQYSFDEVLARRVSPL